MYISVYTCNIFNKNNLSIFSLDLSAPNISELYAVGTAVVNESNPVEMHCKAYGYLVPQITWLRNGTRIPVCVGVGNCDGRHYQALEIKSEDHAFAESWLTIEKTEYPRDQGRYTCIAKNSQTAQKDLEIFIQSMLKCSFSGVCVVSLLP